MDKLSEEQQAFVVQVLCDRANVLDEHLNFADPSELEYYGEMWQEEYEKLQEILEKM